MEDFHPFFKFYNSRKMFFENLVPIHQSWNTLSKLFETDNVWQELLRIISVTPLCDLHQPLSLCNSVTWWVTICYCQWQEIFGESLSVIVNDRKYLASHSLLLSIPENTWWVTIFYCQWQEILGKLLSVIVNDRKYLGSHYMLLSMTGNSWWVTFC